MISKNLLTYTTLQRLETISSTLLQCIQRTLDGGIIFRGEQRFCKKKRKKENLMEEDAANIKQWRGKTRRLPFSPSHGFSVFAAKREEACTHAQVNARDESGPSHLLSYLARLSTASEGVTGCWNPQNGEGGWMGPADSSTGI